MDENDIEELGLCAGSTPHPDHLGQADRDIRRFYELVCEPVPELAPGGTAFSDTVPTFSNLFFVPART